MVTSDRLSAFDVVLDEPIPDKGRVLTALTAFWLDRLTDIAPSHLVRIEDEGRARGAGHAGEAGQDAPHRVHRPGLHLGIGLERVQALRHHARPGPAPRPPAVRPPARAGVHPVDQGRCRPPRREHLLRAGGGDRRQAHRRRGRRHQPGRLPAGGRRRRRARHHHRRHQVRAGLDRRESSPICDEVLTPDSSRFWEASDWKPGTVPPSFDKQPVRDWLEATGWDKRPPPPAAPARSGRRHLRPVRGRLRAPVGQVAWPTGRAWQG